MLREIILLTGAREAPHLVAYLTRHNAALRIVHVETRADLVCALHPVRPGVRLIGFCTSTVVPASLLNDCDAGAYNFHPGPPNYPGRHPASFAIYEGATKFAATAHEMRPRVDSGPIVGIERFDMPPMPRLSQLESLTFDAAVRLFSRLGPLLANSVSPLPVIDETWSGRKSTQHDFEQMCALPSDIGAAEFDRRQRAFADGLQGSLYLTLHGRRFRLAEQP
jgi:methionyl-tRNA formyltransferase